MQNDNVTPPRSATTPTPPAGRAKVSASRRTLLRSGMAAAPLIVTLASRPVLGGQCIAPSATLSGALSHAGPKLGSCSGISRSAWISTSASGWPVLQTTPFHNLFAVGNRAGCRFFKADGVTSLSLLEVLKLTTAQDDSGVGGRVVAAYLNLCSGRVDAKALSVSALQALWREWAVAGQYTPFAGATPWKGADINNYFTNNSIAL